MGLTGFPSLSFDRVRIAQRKTVMCGICEKSGPLVVSSIILRISCTEVQVENGFGSFEGSGRGRTENDSD